MLGMVLEGPDGEVQLSVDWDVVDAHMKRIARSKTRIEIDPECLRWTPLISSIANPFRERLITVRKWINFYTSNLNLAIINNFCYQYTFHY